MMRVGAFHHRAGDITAAMQVVPPQTGMNARSAQD